MYLHIPLIFITVTASVLASNSYDNYGVGDYRICLAQLQEKVNVFEVLPIYGWDNLRNKEVGVVIASNYSKCKLAADGKYLIPDDVYLIPVKRSHLYEFAELITHWHNYSSLTSKSINVNGGLNFHGFGISGQYSDSYQTAKSKQVMDKSYVTRVQLRYIGYTAKLQPKAKIHPKFRNALLPLASSIEMNETQEAKYKSELIVRDFGTHVVNSVDAGAALVQEDFVNREFILNQEMNKRDILKAASANFFGIVHVGVTHKSSTTNKMADSYEKSKTSSNIITFGGSVYSFDNYTAHDWAAKLDNNLVAMDRSGDPLYYLINPDTLPEVPTIIVDQVRDMVREAIERYYSYNVYRGCMDMDSPNFSFQANVDDGTCKPPPTNLTFGGVYQICEMNPGSNAGDLCGALSQPNPKTGKFSCPSNYQATKLFTEKFTKSYLYRECHHCGWWSRCCSSDNKLSTATLTMYWCAAIGEVTPDSGYLFGGLYSSHMDNPMTDSKSCPEAYSTRDLGSDVKICISDDYEEGSMASLPFGGFFSCSAGNPLAEVQEQKSRNTKRSSLLTLKEYYRNTGSYVGPKECPKGFSRHLAIIDQECSIYFCIIAGALSPKGLAPVRLPPFTKRQKFVPENEHMYIYNVNNGTWQLDKTSMKGKASINPDDASTHNSKHDDAVLSPGAAAAIAVCVTLACLGLLFGLMKLSRRRKATNQGYSEIGGESDVITAE